MKSLRVLLVLLLAAGILRAEGEAGAGADPSPVADIQGTRQDLKAIKHGIRKNEQVERKLEQQKHYVLGTLETLNRELAAAQRDALTHKRNLNLVQAKLKQVREMMDLRAQEESSDRTSLESALVGLYKTRARQGPLLLFSARTPAELGTRARYLEALSGAILRRVDALGGDIRQLDSYRKEYESKSVEAARHVREVESDRQRVARERLQKRAELKEVGGKEARVVQAVEELKRLQAAKESMLDSLVSDAQRREADEREEARQQEQQRRKEGPAPSYPVNSSLRRHLPWPVEGPILSRFGKQLHPVFHTSVFNRGIEIGAAFGSPVRAISSGRVAFAGEMEGFGNLVVLDHGGGTLSVYGYGSQLHVRKGQLVEQGSVLEDVGEADAGHQPSLYFEIRQGVKAQDPLRYLGRRT